MLSAVHTKRGPIRGAGGLAEDGDLPAGLGALASALRDALTPVTPRGSYRRELARDLAATARQRHSPQIVLQRPPDYRRGLLIGAAVSSAVSVAGLIAILWHQRGHQSTQTAN